MTTDVQTRLGTKAGDYLDQGYHCSEAVLLAVSEHLFGVIDPLSLRIATPLAGGMGDTEKEACGAFTGGVLVLGMLFGRVHHNQSDNQCLQLTKEWREQFLLAFGHTQCAALQEQGIQDNGHSPCKDIVVQSVPILLQIIAEAKGPNR